MIPQVHLLIFLGDVLAPNFPRFESRKIEFKTASMDVPYPIPSYQMSSSTSSTNMIPRGDFASLGLDEQSVTMLSRAFAFVNETPGGWEVLAQPDIPGANGFMFSTDNRLNELSRKIGDDPEMGHSGASYGWTMRNMESIAKKGWDGYCELFPKRKNPKPQNGELIAAKKQLAELEERVRKLEAENSFLRIRPESVVAIEPNALEMISVAASAANTADPVSNPRGFFKALSEDPTARSIIPDMDEQMSNVNRYFDAVDKAKEDPKSWTKSAGFPYPCPCRRAQGQEGWCGVAGFGVPACEH